MERNTRDGKRRESAIIRVDLLVNLRVQRAEAYHMIVSGTGTVAVFGIIFFSFVQLPGARFLMMYRRQWSATTESIKGLTRSQEAGRPDRAGRSSPVQLRSTPGGDNEVEALG